LPYDTRCFTARNGAVEIELGYEPAPVYKIGIISSIFANPINPPSLPQNACMPIQKTDVFSRG
jgi:hypothetical protein